MNDFEAKLWQRLSDFEIAPGASLAFADRLAAENGWTGAFARRVVVEYKRFLLLAVTAGHSVTPSDAVDQAWHLHLAYTESYWRDLCESVLRRALHHGPTRGGDAEDRRFREAYDATRASYRRTFGSAPPDDVWPPASVRFADARRFRRVDTSAFVLIPRARLRAAGGLLAVAVGLAGCAWLAAGDDGGLSLAGAVVFYLVLIGIAVATIRWINRRAGPKSRAARRRTTSRNSSCGSCGASTDGCSSSHSSSGGCASDGGSSGCGSSGCGGGGD